MTLLDRIAAEITLRYDHMKRDNGEVSLADVKKMVREVIATVEED